MGRESTPIAIDDKERQTNREGEPHPEAAEIDLFQELMNDPELQFFLESLALAAEEVQDLREVQSHSEHPPGETEAKTEQEAALNTSLREHLTEQLLRSAFQQPAETTRKLDSIGQQKEERETTFEEQLTRTLTQKVNALIGSSHQPPLLYVLGGVQSVQAIPAYPTMYINGPITAPVLYGVPPAQIAETLQQQVVLPALLSEAIRQALAETTQTQQIQTLPDEYARALLEVVKETRQNSPQNAELVARLKELAEEIEKHPRGKNVLVNAKSATAEATASLGADMLAPIAEKLKEQNAVLREELDSLRENKATRQQETSEAIQKLEDQRKELQDQLKELAEREVDFQADATDLEKRVERALEGDTTADLEGEPTAQEPGSLTTEPETTPVDPAEITTDPVTEPAVVTNDQTEAPEATLSNDPEDPSLGSNEQTGEPEAEEPVANELHETRVHQSIADLEASILDAQQYLAAKEEIIPNWKRYLRTAAEVLTSVVGSSVGRAIIGGIVTVGMVGVGVATGGIGGVALAAVTGAIGGGVANGVFSSTLHYRVFHREKHAIASEYSHERHPLFGSIHNHGRQEIIYGTYQLDHRLGALAELYNRLGGLDLSNEGTYSLESLATVGVTEENIKQAFQQLYYLRELTNFVGLDEVQLPEGVQINGEISIQEALNRLVVQVPAIMQQNPEQFNAGELVNELQDRINADYNSALWRAAKNKILRGAIVGGFTGALFQTMDQIASGRMVQPAQVVPPEVKTSMREQISSRVERFGYGVKDFFTGDRMLENLGQTARWLGGALLLQAPISALGTLAGDGGYETSYSPTRVGSQSVQPESQQETTPGQEEPESPAPPEEPSEPTSQPGFPAVSESQPETSTSRTPLHTPAPGIPTPPVPIPAVTPPAQAEIREPIQPVAEPEPIVITKEQLDRTKEELGAGWEISSTSEGHHYFEGNPNRIVEGEVPLPNTPLVTDLESIAFIDQNGETHTLENRKTIICHGMRRNDTWIFLDGQNVVELVGAYNNDHPDDQIDTLIVCNPKSLTGGLSDVIHVSEFSDVDNVLHAAGSSVGVQFQRFHNKFHARLELRDNDHGTWFGLDERTEYEPGVDAATKMRVAGKLKELELRSNNRELSSTNFSVPGYPNILWNEVYVGDTPRLPSEDYVRGYLMIEPTDIPEAVDRLVAIGRSRQARTNKGINFKWIAGALPEEEAPTEDITKQHLGEYNGLENTMGRIVIYGTSVSEVQKLLQELYETGWDKFEQNRAKACGRIRRAPRRPGTSAFYARKPDGSTTEVRSMNHMLEPGYSEHSAADEHWRDKQVGTPTIAI